MKNSELYDKFYKCLNIAYKTVENEGDYALIKQKNKLTIYFEWSDGDIDWKNNFSFWAKPYKDMKHTWYCHRGFLKVWKSIEPYIQSDILNPEINEIEIIGYSHGAAIAQLCYEYVKFHRPDIKVEGVGFGAPRVFWGFAKKKIKERFKDFLIVRNGGDIVTHVPPCLFGFRHLGKVVKVGSKIGPIKDHYASNYLIALSALKEKDK